MKNAVTFLLIAVLALGCGLTVGAQRGGSDVPEAAELAVQPGRMPGVIARYSVDRFSLYRSSPVEKSPARQIRLRQYYTEWLGALGRMDFDTMGQDDKVDFLLLKNHLDHELSDLDFEARTVAEAAALVPFGQTITDLEGARRHMEPIDPAKVAAALTGLNKQIETNRKAIEAGLKKDTKTDSTTDGKTDNKPNGNDAAKVDPIKAKKAVANRAALATTTLRNTLKNWYGFYYGYDPVFTWWAEAPYKAVDKSLEEYAIFLREKVVGVKPKDDTAIVGDPIGREALVSALAHEMIPYTPEELIAIANKELAWCEGEIKKAARALGYGDDWRKALEHVKTLYVEPGKQPQLIRDLALEAIQFLDEHDLVSALQRELVGPGRLTHRAFHDAVLKENRIPIEMLRAVLTRQPLARDFVSTWKFYGPTPSDR